MINLFIATAAYSAVRAAEATDINHLLVYIALAVMCMLLIVFGHEVHDLDD